MLFSGSKRIYLRVWKAFIFEFRVWSAFIFEFGAHLFSNLEGINFRVSGLEHIYLLVWKALIAAAACKLL